MMMKISRGFILIILGIILYFPIAKVFQIFLPTTNGLILTLLMGPGFLIVGAVFVIRDRKSLRAKQEIGSDQKEFCGKCGNEISRQNTFCTKCGSESKD